MKKSIFSNTLFIAGLCMMASCGGGSKKSDLTSATEQRTLDPEAKGGNTCLLGYMEKLDALLTDPIVSEFTGVSVATMKKDYYKVMKNPEWHSLQFSWESDRKQKVKVANMTIEVPDKNVIELHGIKPMSKKYFLMSYRVPTEEQLKHVDKAMDDAFSKKTDNKEINEAVDNLDKMGIDQKTQKSIGNEISGITKQVAQAYSEVRGMGDAASWNSFENRLYVLDNGVALAVTVKLSDDTNDNKARALELAKKLLSACD